MSNVAVDISGGTKIGGPAATKPAPGVASSGPAAQPTPLSHKVALGVGVALALALADTRAAPLVMAVLVAGILYQIQQL